MTASAVRASIDPRSQLRIAQHPTASALAPSFLSPDIQNFVVDDGSTNCKFEIVCKLQPRLRLRRRESPDQSSSIGSLCNIVLTLDAGDWWANTWVEILVDAVQERLRAAAAKYSINRCDRINKLSAVLFRTTIGYFDESREAETLAFRNPVLVSISKMTHMLDGRLPSEIYRVQQADSYASYQEVTLGQRVYKELPLFRAPVLRSRFHHKFANLYGDRD
jgi:hypothetical protein